MNNRERTIRDLMRIDPQEWQKDAPLRTVGLDGLSERLRFMVNKRIDRGMWRDFLRGLMTIGKPHQVKIYTIIGYPTETEEDWSEFYDDLCIVDTECNKQKQWSLLVHVTPFRATPATPAAVWPMSYRNYRGVLSAHLKQKHMKGNVFFQGNAFWAVEGMGTDSLPTLLQSAIMIRGTEKDAESVETIARAYRYWGASSAQKTKALEKLFNLDDMLRAYTWDDLPTRYLKSYCRDTVIPALSERVKKYGSK